MASNDNIRIRQQALTDALATRILLLDGAMGTMIQAQALTPADFGGADLDGCNENLVRTRPDVIAGIHRGYLAAGADIIKTDTFGGTQLVLAEYGLEKHAGEINRRAAELARAAADEFSKPGRPRFVAGSIGPTTKSLTITGGIAFSDLRQHFHEQARALVEGGADILVVETCHDTRNAKAALVAIAQLAKELGHRIPTMLSVTIEPSGTMLAGHTAEALYVSVAHADLLCIGLNCSTGPDMMTDHLRSLHEHATTRVSCYPNAGLPDENGRYLETPEKLAGQLERFVRNGWLNIVGGCCGTTPEHIRALASVVDGKPPRAVPPSSHRTWISGIDLVEAEDTTRPLIVGERTNVIGSRIFKKLIADEKWEEATEIARAQVRSGAQVVDVCLQSSDRDELRDIPLFYERLVRKIKAPVMVDTTDPAALELALAHCPGKSIINSVNLEDGEERFQKVCPIVKAYGAVLIAGCIDEDKQQAQAFTRERKLAIAERSTALLTQKYGIAPEDIVIDPLVFPCATGDENYIGGAVETIEALRLVKEKIPHVKTILGISNVSFGLPPAAREVVNSVFLYHCTKAGLDFAIVNSEKIERFASIPAEDRVLAENLLFNAPPLRVPLDHPAAPLLANVPQDWRDQPKEQRAAVNQFHIAAISDRFRTTESRTRSRGDELPLDARISNYIIQGSKDGLTADLDHKRAEGAAPLDIINGPLMAGMAEVGRLFNQNELIVAEVLQSAEAMKAAVSHLEQFMEKSETVPRGTILLATVKGDVHDIGRNLVEIILSNNGYRTINLGIKVASDRLIQAYHEHAPDAIGLSGLLVKSAQQMAISAGDLKEAGISVPLLVGGAALSESFTKRKIAPSYCAPTFYAKDAMTGLRLLNQIMDPETRDAILAAHTVTGTGEDSPAAEPAAAPVASHIRSGKVRTDLSIPAVPSLDRKMETVEDLAEIWTHINPYMLYGRHLGYKGNFEKDLGEGAPKAAELFRQMEEVKKEASQFMKARAVWRFFEAERDGNSIRLFLPPAAEPVHTFAFRRQPRPDGLCLSDYVLEPRDGRRDHVAIFVVTAGEGIRERTEIAKAAGEYFRAHALQALAVETAEASAEWLHRRLRAEWGFADAPGMTMQERFTSRYRGKRYSFGYGACPDMTDQQGIWALLHPEEIGVHLTEGMMMQPEASVSALVFHHPDCAYFTASEPDAS
ncbi:MAG: methionine synthase [Acidobacteriia bacterium]|nr:methionine synthase [Terriglobia bacterium]